VAVMVLMEVEEQPGATFSLLTIASSRG
jgi:hypothetical protein